MFIIRVTGMTTNGTVTFHGPVETLREAIEISEKLTTRHGSYVRIFPLTPVPSDLS